MPKVSNNKLPERTFKKLFTLLPEMINACQSANQADSFVNSLFSSSEKIMISKRIAIILLLCNGKSYEAISAKLKVSQGTIAKMAEAISHADKAFMHEFDKVVRSDAASDFWNELGYKLDTLIPPKGANWSSWRSRKIRERLEGEQPF